MTALDLILLITASFYVAYVVARTSGPFGVFANIQAIFSAHQSTVQLAKLMMCFYCLVFWVGLAFYLLLLSDSRNVIYPFAIAGAASLLYRYTGAGHVD